MRGGGPAMAPGLLEEIRGEEMRWRQLDSSVNAVSFGFVATAILVSMFLLMAIFEHFLRPPGSSPPLPSHLSAGGRGLFFRRRSRTPVSNSTGADLEAAQRRRGFAGKLDSPSPEMPVYARGVSVLMPGHDVPTFIAHPAPAPCPPEKILWPSHQSNPFGGSSSNPS